MENILVTGGAGYLGSHTCGRRGFLSVYGSDYPTPDGTGVRDYIHVVDLAMGHIAAVVYGREHPGVEAINLGTGKGYSVLAVVNAYERASGVSIPYRMAPRRPGDIAISFADPTKAHRLLGWKAEKTLEDMCRSAHEWQRKNPDGFK